MRKIDLHSLVARSHDRSVGRLAEDRLDVVEQFSHFGRLAWAESLGKRWWPARQERTANVPQVLDHIRLLRCDMLQALSHLLGSGFVGRRQLGSDLGDATINIATRTDQKKRSAYGDHVAITHDPHLNILAVHLCAVGAFQICQHNLVVIFLQFEVITADTLIVELNRVAFLATDRHRGRQVVKDFTAVRAVQNSKSDVSHEAMKPCSAQRSDCPVAYRQIESFSS